MKYSHYRILIEDEGFQRARYLRLSQYPIPHAECEFVRRCTHSEVILSRLADDFIARYSPKSSTHP